MMIRAYIKRAVEAHALKAYPKEACGLLVADGRRQKYISCENTASNNNDFRIAPDRYAEVEDQYQVLAVIHSHIDIPPKPSEADIVSCEATGIPWHIVSVGQDPDDAGPKILGWHSFEPTGYEAPLVGRQFFHGRLDCYTLIRDFYQRELGIEIPDFERPDDWWSKAEHGELYLENFEAAGFVQVHDGPIYGDVALMQYRSDRTNHGGVYLGDIELKSQPGLHPVPNAMLHHAMPMLSERCVYAGYWLENTRIIVRHKELI